MASDGSPKRNVVVFNNMNCNCRFPGQNISCEKATLTLIQSYLGMTLYCDKAVFEFCGINRPHAVVGPQDFKVPYFSLEER